MRRLPTGAEDVLLLAITAAGLVLFIAPLVVGSSFPQPAALFSGLIVISALVALAVAMQTNRLSARLLAVLAALVAIDATLRLVIVIGLLGFSPIFFLIIVAGYVMGPGFGFAMGALTLLLSAVLTAGFGPWLPYQMLAAGWMGMGAGFLRRVIRRPATPAAIALLAAYGAAAGFGFGALLDLWEWPFLLGAASSPISWAPGLGAAELVRRFGAFYLTTSFVYDAFRAAGNAILLVVLSAPVVSALDRFRRRFLVAWSRPLSSPEATPTNIQSDVGTPA